ncbi:MAG: caspase family protein [Desulfuromonadales bacterium]
MLRSCFLSMVCLLSCCLVASAAEDRSLVVYKKNVSTERRLALVIGNSSYTDAPLKNPVNDADVMVKALKETGFDVVVRKNADRRAMFSAIKEFGQKLKKSDVGLFYYAGHGVQVDSSNYLLPVDLRNSELQDAEDLRRDALPLNELMERMRDAGTNNIVILDACRDNPFMTKFSRSASRGLAKVVTPSSTSILYSTDPGNTASDGASGDNGVFTKRLVEAIQKEGVELVDVMRDVSSAVSRDTNGSQRPVFDGVMGTKFYFRAMETPPPPVPAQISVDTRVVDLRYWESAEKTNSISALRSYLKKFPTGDFADIALEKIQLLEQAKTQSDSAAKADLERRVLEAAEQSRLAKERTEQDRRLQEMEAKIQQSEVRSRQAEERAAKASQAAALEANLKQVQPERQQVTMLPKDAQYKTITATKELGKLFTATELTMLDNKTGLMWVRNGGLTGKIAINTARQFLDKINMKMYGGFDDWRLPTKKELETLVKYAKDDGWGNKDGHYVSDYLVSKGFVKVQPEYYLTDNTSFAKVQAVRMWSGHFEELDNVMQHINAFDTRILPVRGTLQ